MSPLAFFGLFAFLFGLCVGSFLNVCIARMPEDRSIVYPASHCPHCGHTIRPYDNIPVLSWLWLRARCRDCKTPISSLYPTIELLTGIIAWLLFQSIVPDLGALDLAHGVAWAFFFSIAAMLIAESYIDIRHFIIPDEFSIYAVPYAIGGMALLSWLGYPEALSWQLSLLGAFFGGGSLALLTVLWSLLRRYEGMGWGDVKLLALIGAIVGPLPGLFFVLIVSSITGIIVGIPLGILSGRGLRHALPFGPFLALAAIVWMLDGPHLMNLYMPSAQFVFDSYFSLRETP